jgi:hypothetical protein
MINSQPEIPEYTGRTIRAFARYPELFPGGAITHHFVEHDHWCALLVLGRPCDCNPDVTAEIQGKHYRVSPEGKLEAIRPARGA